MRRRKPVLVAVALCLGGALTACGGGGDGEGYAAVGVGASPGAAGTPSGAVALVPLDGPTTTGDTSSTSSPSPTPDDPLQPPPTGGNPAAPGASGASGASGTSGSSGTDTGTGTGPGTSTGTGAGSDAAPAHRPGGSGTSPGTGGKPSGPGTGTPPGSPSAPPSTPAPGTSAPPPPATSPPAPGPAVVTVSAPVLADGDRRWCEKVTVTFRNTGGTAARSGTVTFATHVIGALGVDWATLTSSQPLPAPIAPGTARTETYTVCVDSWRVPLGMRIDTRKVSATWR
ncbi:hypothetical protein [Streptomyces sp. NPDC057695]|uniref:hypothetical protein n=1 Tax=Streptomyces sp. NPDC057695 TaxID=3346217 RepID=UPI0036B2AF4E